MSCRNCKKIFYQSFFDSLTPFDLKIQRYHGVSPEDPMRQAFLKRLKTFDVFNWSGKPIDPPQCAKHGWEIAEKDVLKCVMCHQYLSVSLPLPSKHLSCKYN